ncbi:hypothetical protein [Natrinema salaciae]|uniref:Uncharacterized protein n=1 Tax=Natrinema salaciae TaxID=1186196 RepID=A0A1H9CUD5_9EURY|nr:hypothetical protein [Natrinema salaciae]SEQ04188.1 hypothetical protein SAMN04489841_1145 [Natrinema salaciae]
MDEEIPKELIDDAVASPNNEAVADLSDKTVIYFDQKAWGATWEAANSVGADATTLDTLAKRSADELNFVYPFSIENLVETTSASDLEFKTELFDIMMDLSGNLSIRNYFDVFDHEVRRYICKWHELLPELDTQSFVFGEGLVHVGGDWKIKTEGGMEVPEGLEEEFEKVLRDEEINRRLLQSRALSEEAPGVPNEEKKEYEERYRENVQETEGELDLDSDEDRSLYLADVFGERMMPDLRQYAFELGLHPAEIVATDPYQRSFEAFFQQFPAFYTYATLCFAADARRNNSPDFNDVFDISQLAVAAPYADVVVTEQFFGGMLYKFNIGETFDTEVFTDTEQFIAFLQERLD